jgi:RNA polymerase sigma-70 factor (ECF subfamily)
MNDTDLMLRVRNGDEEAFRQIVERYHKSILNLCFRFTGIQEDAEEVAQDVFINIYRTAGSYEPRAKLSTYLYRIAVNLSLNKVRDRKRKRLISWEVLKTDRGKQPVASNKDAPDTILENKEKSQIVQKAIDSLPSNQKTAVILKRYQGLSYEEIAKVMNCSVSAVEARLHRAKNSLKKKLKPFVSRYNKIET